VHERILRAAVERFDSHGVEATRIDDICAAADVAQKTFFNHFPTRQHLVREIAVAFLDELVATLEETRRETGTTAQRLERFFTRVAAEAATARPMRRTLVMEVIRLVHDDRLEAEQGRRLHASFGALIRDGVRAGDVSRTHSVAVLTEIVVGAYYSLMLGWLGTDRYPIRARAIGIARLLRDALAAGRSHELAAVRSRATAGRS